MVLVLLLLLADSPVEIFQRAIAALAAGNYAAAESGFREVLQAVPDHSGALLNLGVVYSRTGRLDDAIFVYRKVLQSNPSEKAALANLGIAYVKKGDFREAMTVFRKLAEVNPESAALRDRDLMYQFASGYLRLEGSKEAVEIARGTAKAYVLCRLDFNAGRFDEAAAECREAGSHRELGKVLVSQHSADAAGELQAALREDPRDAEAQYYLGVATMQEGRTAEAVPQLERAMQLDATFWGTYFYLGRARMELGQTAEAVPLLRKAAEMNPRAAVVFYELGRALIATGKAEEGARAMQRVRELRAQELDADAQALRKR